MKIYENPDRKDWDALLARPAADNAKLYDAVNGIMQSVKLRGDEALREYELRFDNAALDGLQVTPEEMSLAEEMVLDDLKQAIAEASDNIAKFHAAQKTDFKKVETAPGVECWQKASAIEKVGLYVPGGTAPLFSTVLMLAIPAKIAGCGEIVLCTPPRRDGSISPAILYAAKAAGVSKIFKIGGAQAIAAMTFGTATIPKVYKIFGPGNPYVTMAKQIAALSGAAIDMPAGPSEVAIIADRDARPEIVAADMISQAEHGVTSQAMVFTDSPELALATAEEARRQRDESPRAEFIGRSLENSRLFVLGSLGEAMEMCNCYAPEHLIISCRDYARLADEVRNAGSVFLGYHTPESAGDYASGTNHTLPTSGYAKMYSGVNLDAYVKKITFQHISPEGLGRLAPTICTMAENEFLEAHKRAVTIRQELL